MYRNWVIYFCDGYTQEIWDKVSHLVFFSQITVSTNQDVLQLSLYMCVYNLQYTHLKKQQHTNIAYKTRSVHWQKKKDLEPTIGVKQ